MLSKVKEAHHLCAMSDVDADSDKSIFRLIVQWAMEIMKAAFLIHTTKNKKGSA